MRVPVGFPWGLVAGIAADSVFGDPKRHHPVAWFGHYATWLERALYRDTRTAGVIYWVAAVAPPVAGAVALQRASRRLPTSRAQTIAREGLLGLAVWASLGGVFTATSMSMLILSAHARGCRGCAPAILSSSMLRA